MIAPVYDSTTNQFDYEEIIRKTEASQADLSHVDSGGDKSQKYGIKLYSALDFLQPEPPVEWMVESLLAPGLITVFFGEPGCKKTWTTVDLAVCTAMGEDWLRYKTKQARVLLIDEESGITWYRPRVKQVIEGHGGNYNIPLMVSSLAGLDLRNKNDRRELEDVIRGEGIQSIGFDALSDGMPGANENDADDVISMLRPMRDLIAETQCSLFMTHHNNKDGRYRGSTAVKQHADIFMKVMSSPKSSVIKFASEKVRNGAPLNFEADAVFGEGYFRLNSRASGSETLDFGAAQSHALKYLFMHGTSNTNTIKANPVDCDPETVRTNLSTLVKNGLIEEVPTGKKEKSFRLTEAGMIVASRMMRIS